MAVNNPEYIIVHCTDIPTSVLFDQFNAVNKYHQSEKYIQSSLGYFVGYHRLITGGKNYKCKEDGEQGSHCNQVVNGSSMNFQSLGVCWGGDGDLEYPNSQDFALLRHQIHEWQDRYGIPNERVKFHRNYNLGKTCPGSLLGGDWLARLLDRTPENKPADQAKKQRDILKQISRLQKIVDRLKRLLAKRI